MGFIVVNRGGVYEVQRDGQVLFQGLSSARMLELTENQDKELARVCSVALGLVAPNPATKTDKPDALKDAGYDDPPGDEPVKMDKPDKAAEKPAKTKKSES